MQCARAILVTWLGSGSCQAWPSRPNTNEWMNCIVSSSRESQNMPRLNSMLFCVVTYVGSCLPTFWDGLLAPMSRVMQSKKNAENRRMYGYKGDGVPCRMTWDWPHNLQHTKILSTKSDYMNWLVREARIGASSQQYEPKGGLAVRGSSKSPIHSLRECSCAPPHTPTHPNGWYDSAFCPWGVCFLTP